MYFQVAEDTSDKLTDVPELEESAGKIFKGYIYWWWLSRLRTEFPSHRPGFASHPV